MSATEDPDSSTLLLRLIWKTERPCEEKDIQSPLFTFKNHEWFLKLRNDSRHPPTFNLFMVSTKELEVFPTFTVKTLYKESGSDDVLFKQCLQINTCRECISCVNISDVMKIDSFKVYGIFNIVCELHDSDISSQCCGSEGPRVVNLFTYKSESLLGSQECPSSTQDQILSLEKLSKDLENLLDSEVLPDTQLKVEETSIPCHRAVLVARSKVFAAMFQHKMTESLSGVLEIKDIDLSVIKIFLKYLYIGKIPDDLTEEELVNLYKAGDKYEVDDLKRVSASEMLKSVNDKNYLSYLTLADTHSDQIFKDAIVRYIIKNVRLFKSQDWIHFSSENPRLSNEVFLKYFNGFNLK